jgi:prepilin-type N-terminal cleavage/methylation domain-containing protein/prepilin-type processing-associated H-X9-DG protein
MRKKSQQGGFTLVELPIVSKRAFTLVELLVVIGIIALLLSILLPVFNRARAQANSVVCLSNLRQLGTAAIMFQDDHHGHVPPCSDNQYAAINDPYGQNFSYRNNGGVNELQDWASALLPYMGDRSLIDFQKAPTDKTKVFVCPSDEWITNGIPPDPPGHRLYNNVTNGVSGYQLVSYGYNADIACLLDANGVGQFNPNGTNYVSVYMGDPDGVHAAPKNGRPLNCKYTRIVRPAEVLLFADCGTRPVFGTPNVALDDNTLLYYTTNFCTAGGTLQTIWQKVNLQDRIPIRSATTNHVVTDRHPTKRLNIAFADGHGENVGVADFARIRVSPYRY